MGSILWLLFFSWLRPKQRARAEKKKTDMDTPMTVKFEYYDFDRKATVREIDYGNGTIMKIYKDKETGEWRVINDSDSWRT